MQLRLWGTRGSLPRAANRQTYATDLCELIDHGLANGLTSLTEFRDQLTAGQLDDRMPLGGHTACYQVTRNDYAALIDMGSGLIDASSEALKNGQKSFEFFITHMHWDHIIGLPFFVPLYTAGCNVVINHVHSNAPDHIKLLFNGVNFPLKWEDLSANITFNHLKLYQPVNRGDLVIRPFALDHPGGSFGYRFDCPDGSATLAVDSESVRVTPKEMGKDLEFYQNLDLLLFDGQYDLNELASRFDWGHSTPPIGVNIALREGIRNLLLSHHDPQRSSEGSESMLAKARRYAADQLGEFSETWKQLGQENGPNIFNAYDGMQIRFEKGETSVIDFWGKA